MKDLHSVSNSWQTPDDLFNILDKGGEYQGMHFEGYHFTVDLCASEKNRKKQFWSEDYLNNKYLGWYDCPHKADENLLSKVNCAFMNPPYSNPKPFIEKAWEDAARCRIVALVKCDTSTKWFAVFYDHNNRRARPGCEIIYFPKRIKFNPPQELIIKNKLSGPTFSSALIIMDRRNV